VALGAAAWRFVPRETASVALTVGERWSHAALALGAFVRRLLLPFDVSLSPPHPAAIGPRSAALLALQAIALAGLCAAGWRLRRRRPALALGGLWFLALAIPHLVSTRDGSLCSARDNHLAAFGLWYALVLEGRTLAQQRGLSPRRRVELGGATLLALVAASALQLAQWTSPRSLARRALALDARNFAAHDVLGFAFLDEGRLSPAVLEHRAALERAPRDARALAQLGVIELRRGLIPGLEGHFHEARRHLEEAVAIVPDSARTWGLLGEVLQRSELLQEAVPALERALELDGTRAQTWTHLGMVRIALGELDGAQNAFEHATRLSPGLPDPVCGLGILRFQAEDFDGAREYLERTIALEPDHVAAHTTLGRIHELRDDVAGAEREYRRALAVNPDHSDALFALAAICEHSGRAEEALRIARRLVELRPTHVRANLAVGRILFGLGDFEGARAALEAVLRLNPEHPEGRKLLEQLPPPPGQRQSVRRRRSMSAATGGRERPPTAWVVAGLVVLAFAAYARVGSFGFVSYDDPDYVTTNPWVRDGLTWPGVRWALTAAHASNWHPLTWLAHMLDVELYELRPAGHHWSSVILHAASSGLCFVALRALTRRPWPRVLGRGALRAAPAARRVRGLDQRAQGRPVGCLLLPRAVVPRRMGACAERRALTCCCSCSRRRGSRPSPCS
jgi:tetratricopeptide (TPR) repeat protein